MRDGLGVRPNGQLLASGKATPYYLTVGRTYQISAVFRFGKVTRVSAMDLSATSLTALTSDDPHRELRKMHSAYRKRRRYW